MIIICCEMSRTMRSYDIVVMLEGMTVQNSAPGVCQTRIPHLIIGVIIARKYKMLIVLGQCHEFLGEKGSTGWDVYSADCKSL
jgi:hypothetical protein